MAQFTRMKAGKVFSGKGYVVDTVTSQGPWCLLQLLISGLVVQKQPQTIQKYMGFGYSYKTSWTLTFAFCIIFPMSQNNLLLIF